MSKNTFTIKGSALYTGGLWDKDRMSGKHQFSLVVPRDEAEALIEAINEEAQDSFAKAYKAGKVVLNYAEDDDGNIVFKLKNSYRPTIVDAKNRPIARNPNIGQGSILKVRCYPLAAGGQDATKKSSIMIVPKSVMIVDLVPYVPGGFSEDDVEEGYEADADIVGTPPREEYSAPKARRDEPEEDEDEVEEAPKPPKPPRRKVGF